MSNRTYMLAQSPHNEATLLSSSCILQQSIDDPLLSFDASVSLTVGDLDQGLKYALDGERLRLAKRQTLSLLGFECHISSIAMLVVQRLQ